MTHSYHDVVVIVNGTRYRIADNYAYRLICTRAGGWQLVWAWDKEERLIGGEYDGGKFTIEVAGIVVCGKKQKRAEDAQPTGGWDGTVSR